MQRAFTPRAIGLAGAIALLMVTLGSAGCSHKYSGDGAADGAAANGLLAPSPSEVGIGFENRRSLYPLAVGNHWTYRVRTTNQITTDTGPQPPVTEEDSLVVGITAAALNVGDETYFEQVEAQVRGDTLIGSLFYVRANRLGLFEASFSLAPSGVAPAVPAGDPASSPTASALTAYVDRTITDAAQRAAFQRAAAEVATKLAAVDALAGRPSRNPLRQGPRTGAQPGEITILSYPLFPGARWVVLDDPHFARMVVGRDQIHVPFGTFGAWKIRGTAEAFGPDDRLYLWYSPLGLLRMRYHVSANVVDVGDHVIGRVVTDFDQSLTNIHLERPGAALTADDGDH